MHVKEEGCIWHSWNAYWIGRAERQEVPIYFFRFEDVMTDPEPELKTILSLALGLHPEALSEDSYLLTKIREVIGSGTQGNTLYKPRGEGGINKNLDKYTPEQLAYLITLLEDQLHYFGYTDSDPTNPFGFFPYGKFNHTRFSAFRD